MYNKINNKGSILIAVLAIVTVFLMFIVSLTPTVETTAQLSVISEKSEKMNSFINGKVDEAFSKLSNYHTHGVSYKTVEDNFNVSLTYDNYSISNETDYDRVVTVDITVEDEFEKFSKNSSFSVDLAVEPYSPVLMATIPQSSSRNIVDMTTDSESFLYVLNSDEFYPAVTQSITIYKIIPDTTYYKDITSDIISLQYVSNLDIDVSSVYPTGISVKRSINTSISRSSVLNKVVVYVSYASFSGTGQLKEFILNNNRTSINSSSTLSGIPSDDYYDVEFNGNNICYFSSFTNRLEKYLLSTSSSSVIPITYDSSTCSVNDIINAGNELFLLCEDNAGDSCTVSYISSNFKRKNTISISGTSEISKMECCFDTIYCATHTDMKVINAFDNSVLQHFTGFSSIEAVTSNKYYNFISDPNSIYNINKDQKQSNFKLSFKK